MEIRVGQIRRDPFDGEVIKILNMVGLNYTVVTEIPSERAIAIKAGYTRLMAADTIRFHFPQIDETYNVEFILSQHD